MIRIASDAFLHDTTMIHGRFRKTNGDAEDILATVNGGKFCNDLYVDHCPLQEAKENSHADTSLHHSSVMVLYTHTMIVPLSVLSFHTMVLTCLSRSAFIRILHTRYSISG